MWYTYCSSPPSSEGCLWFGLAIQGPSRSAITVAVATAPIATTTTSSALIQAEGLETTALCALWIPGCWAGPTTPEVHEVQRVLVITYYWTLLHIILYYYIHYYYVLLCFLFFIINTSLLRIITLAIVTYYYKIIITYYYIIISSL